MRVIKMSIYPKFLTVVFSVFIAKKKKKMVKVGIGHIVLTSVNNF